MHRLLSLPKSQPCDGLSHIFSEKLGHPERAFATVHITGTNGKGSVSIKTARALEASGLKVGLFISPHLFHFQERISINGQPISPEEITEGLDELYALGLPPHFFTLTTFLAFTYFRKKQVDIAVIEVGIGGTKDPTNVVHPIVSVITSISLDHTSILGSTVEEIARDKAGIIKPGAAVVVGPRALYPPILERASKLGSALYVADKGVDFEMENRSVARTVLEVLNVTPQAIERGVESALPCRFEMRGDMLFDVAHNPDGFKHLIEALKQKFPTRTPRFVIGMSDDKDVEGSLTHIQRGYVHLVQGSYPWCIPTKKMAGALERVSQVPFSEHASVRGGVETARCMASAEDLIVICGSFYIMAEAAEVLSLNHT